MVLSGVGIATAHKTARISLDRVKRSHICFIPINFINRFTTVGIRSKLRISERERERAYLAAAENIHFYYQWSLGPSYIVLKTQTPCHIRVLIKEGGKQTHKLIPAQTKTTPTGLHTVTEAGTIHNSPVL